MLNVLPTTAQGGVSLPVQTVVSCFLCLGLYLGVFLLQTEGTQDSILPGGRTGEASPFPRVFCTGEVCCLLSAKECLCFYGLGDSCPNFCWCDTAQEPPQFQLQLGYVSFQPFWLQVRYLVTWKHQWGHWGLRIKLHLPFLWSLRVLCVQEGPDFIQVYQKLVYYFWALHLCLLPALLSG